MRSAKRTDLSCLRDFLQPHFEMTRIYNLIFLFLIFFELLTNSSKVFIFEYRFLKDFKFLHLNQ